MNQKETENKKRKDDMSRTNQKSWDEKVQPLI